MLVVSLFPDLTLDAALCMFSRTVCFDRSHIEYFDVTEDGLTAIRRKEWRYNYIHI